MAASVQDAESGLGETGPRESRASDSASSGLADRSAVFLPEGGTCAAPSVTCETVQTQTGAEMVLIPAGSFLMGSADGEPDEAPPHEVTLDAFLMDRTEVTQEQYGKLVLGNPSHFKGDDRPVEQISWADAALYCNLRSQAEGLEPCYDEETAKCNFQANGYRLPTEAEWEYACRAGTGDAYAFGADPRVAGTTTPGSPTMPARRRSRWPEEAQRLGPVRHARQRGRMVQRRVRGRLLRAQSRPRIRRGRRTARSTCCAAARGTRGPQAADRATRVGREPGFQDACFARDAIGFRCVRRQNCRATAAPSSTVVIACFRHGHSCFVIAENGPRSSNVKPPASQL